MYVQAVFASVKFCPPKKRIKWQRMEYELKPILHQQKHGLKKATWLVGFMSEDVVRMPNSRIDVCLICIVDCSFIMAPQESTAIENVFSNIKKFGLFHRVKSRGASYECNELTYFILAACVLHNCEIQFDFTKWLPAYS